MTDIFIVLNMNLNFEYVTPSVERVLGYSTEEVKGKKLKDLLPRDSLKRALRVYREVLRSTREKTLLEFGSRTLELEILDKKGKTIWSEVKLNLVADPKKKKFLILGVVRDTTERHLSRLKIMESEKKYRNLVEQLPLGLLIAQGLPPTLCFFNYAFTKMLGYSAQEIGKFTTEQIQNLIHPEDRNMFFARYKNRLEGKKEPLSYNVRAIRKDGTIRSVDVFANNIMFQGKPSVQAVFMDVTEVKKAEVQLKQSYEQLQRTIEETVSAMARIVEMRDPYTSGHQRKVAELSKAIAKEMKLSPPRIRGLYMAALVHDIGKMCVPSDILSRPSVLNEKEFALVKVHPEVGYDILKPINFPWPVAEIVVQHHEHIDGSGYPKGLKGKKIRLESKILGVADVVEAMCSHRPYRPAHTLSAALEEIVQRKRIHFDPDVVDACCRLFTEKKFSFP
ncbi:MAG: PAS domain S-box protein [Candidatus Aminicenantes bacterium]|nr:PAS domain S-box protein [Candidatus Aminicenantes bacterium]